MFASAGLSGPWGLAFSAAGDLYAANAGDDAIERFTPGGVGSTFGSTGPNSPTYLAFGPVPTPEPAPLAALALGAVAALRRRGRA